MYFCLFFTVTIGFEVIVWDIVLFVVVCWLLIHIVVIFVWVDVAVLVAAILV